MLIKNILQSKLTTIFLIFSFTITSLSFIFSNSIINEQKKLLKQYDSKYNKQIFIDSSNKFTIDEISNLLCNENLRLELKFENPIDKIYISTIVLDNFLNYENITTGSKLSPTENNSNEKITIISTLLNDSQDEINFTFNTSINSLKVNGVFKDLSKNIIIPTPLFIETLETNKINDTYLTILLSGSEANLLKANDILTNYIKEKDSNGSIFFFDYIKEDKLLESKIYEKLSFNISFIILLNAIAITALWITKRKKELAIRKALGATNLNLMSLYFKELLFLNFLSLILVAVFYYFIIIFTNGKIANFNIDFNITSYIETGFIMFFITSLISTFSLFYLTKLNPITLLKE